VYETIKRLVKSINPESGAFIQLLMILSTGFFGFNFFPLPS
jgi:hypothetical protein